MREKDVRLKRKKTERNLMQLTSLWVIPKASSANFIDPKKKKKKTLLTQHTYLTTFILAGSLM